MEFELERCDLRSLRPVDADQLYDVIAANRRHLARWLPWADRQTLTETREFIDSAVKLEATGEGLELAVTQDERIVGMVGLRIDPQNRAATIGYWLAEAVQGTGLMTAALRRLIDHAFRELDLNRVEIRAAADNERSRALCARLGFAEEGLLRDAERVGDASHDLVVSSILSREWPK